MHVYGTNTHARLINILIHVYEEKECLQSFVRRIEKERQFSRKQII